jgi:hypothetical protein
MRLAQPDQAMLAEAVLAIHLAVIAFNLFGLLAVPLGAWRGWCFVRRPTWRFAHLVCLAIVAIQAALGRACFLTILQDALAGRGPSRPLIERIVDSVVFWPLPIWAFTAAYMVVFIYALALMWLVPPKLRRSRPRPGAA